MSQTLARALAVPIGIYALPDAWMTRRNQQAVLLDHACPNDERQQHEDPYQEFADAAHGDSRRGGQMLYTTYVEADRPDRVARIATPTSSPLSCPRSSATTPSH